MTDLDERLRAAGEAFREQPVPDLDLHWPAQTRGQRWIAPLAVAAAVALVVGGVLAVASWHHDSAQPPAKPSPATVIQPDRNFAVAAPPAILGHSSAPNIGASPPTCNPRAVTASAVTHPAADGVMGLIALAPGSDCSVRSKLGDIRLLDAAGKALNLPLGKGNQINNFASSDTTATRLYGPVRVGFAWTGSYCGPAPSSIEINVNGTWLRAPFHGAVPACATRTDGELIVGGVGAPSQPVIPPPLAWKALSARLVLPRTVKSDRAIELNVVLTNKSTIPVSLSAPCPTWSAEQSVFVAGNPTNWGSAGALCSDPLTVMPGHPLTLFLGWLAYTRGMWHSGDDVTVSWGMAGVPMATAKTKIQ
ncbi:MAG: hypothetical protein JWN96_168 [Mycobacterium sp.]|nr:hypothetical protein [Mycobacterium sp.]